MNGLKKNIVFWSLAATGFFVVARNAQAQSTAGSVSASATVPAYLEATDTSNRMPSTHTGGLVFTSTTTY